MLHRVLLCFPWYRNSYRQKLLVRVLQYTQRHHPVTNF